MATAVASAMKEAQSFWEKAISSSPSKGSSGRGSEGERYGSEDNHDEAAMKIQQEQRARLHCVSLLLDWNGLEIDGVSERPAVNAVDDQGNTALHYAAAMGLSECTDVLIRHRAILTLVNTAQQTPCDMAGANSHTDLADALEARMIFGIKNSAEGAARASLTAASADNAGAYDPLSDAAAAAAAAEIPEVRESADDFSSLDIPSTILLAETLAEDAAQSIAAGNGAFSLSLDVRVVEHLLATCNWNKKNLQRRLAADCEQLLRDAKISDDLWESWSKDAAARSVAAF